MNSNKNNFDTVASAGVAEGTPCDTFMNMNGKSIFIVADDIDEQGISNGDMLHDGDEIDDCYIIDDLTIGVTDEVLDGGGTLVHVSEIPTLKSEC